MKRQNWVGVQWHNTHVFLLLRHVTQNLCQCHCFIKFVYTNVIHRNNLSQLINICVFVYRYMYICT